MNSSERRRHEFERRLSRFAGSRLARVLYIDTPIPGLEPTWDRDSAHTLNQGIDLEMDDGRLFHVTWDNEFFCYGLAIRDGSLQNWLRGESLYWDMTPDRRWFPYVGHVITDILVRWSYVEDQADGTRIDYPQSLELRFASGEALFLSALQYFEDGEYWFGMADWVTILFGEEGASEHGIDPYSGLPMS